MVLETAVDQALGQLAGARHRGASAVSQVPKAAGLYAFYGDDQAWRDLDLTPAFDGQPLYVGKAENCVSRRGAATRVPGCAKRSSGPFPAIPGWAASSARCPTILVRPPG